MSDTELDHYQVMNVPYDVNFRGVEAAYGLLTTRYRTELAHDYRAYRVALERLNEAYGVLVIPERRAAYDRSLGLEPRAQAPLPAAGRPSRAPFRDESTGAWRGTFDPPRAPVGEEVTYTRRLMGDYWLENVLVVFTLGLGWLVWFAIVAPRGQTPAKQILDVFLHDARTGERVGAGRTWLRELVCKHGAEALIGLVLVVAFNSADAWNWSVLYPVVGGLFIFGQGRRALWDHLAGTVVLRGGRS